MLWRQKRGYIPRPQDKRAWDNDFFRKVEVQNDSEVLVGWLNSGCVTRYNRRNLLNEIKKLILKIWEVQIIHVFREGNESLVHDRGLRIVDVSPAQLLSFLREDESVHGEGETGLCDRSSGLLLLVVRG